MSGQAENSVQADYSGSPIVRQKLAFQQQADSLAERHVVEQFAHAVDEAVEGRSTIIFRHGEGIAAIVPLALLHGQHAVEDTNGTEDREFGVLRFER